MRHFFAILVACIVAFGYTSSVRAAVSSTELQTVVKIEIHNAKGVTVSTAGGVQLDADGRILTTYSAIRAWEKEKKPPITICATKDVSSEPHCTWQAVVIKSNSALDLALLQVRSIYVDTQWVSVEETILRSSFAFTPIKSLATSTSEMVGLGDELWIAGYPAAGGATITTNKSSVTGYRMRTLNKKEVPWMIKSDIIFTAGQTGGAAFDASGRFVGMPAYTTTTANQFGAVIGIPTINAFVKDAIGNAYLLGKLPLLFTQPLIGVQSGSLQTTSCPAFSTLEKVSKSCRCDAGFYAVGNTCLKGSTYCELRFPKTGSYDPFVKQCLCPNTKGGVSECTLPKPSIPKPIATVVTTTPLAILEKACKNVKNGEWNKKTKSCACKSGFSFNSLRSTCTAPVKKAPPVVIGKPKKLSDLALCQVIGKVSTKRYYLKGHPLIKQMTHVGKICFVDEATAKKAKYVKGK